MWEIILNSIIKSKIKCEIYIKTRTMEKENMLKEKYKVNLWINKDADIVILAIKPNQFKEINLNIFNKNTIIISIMAGISIKKIKEKSLSDKIIRTMPNTPSLVWKWIIWYTATNNILKNEIQLFKKLFSKTWKTIALNNEDEINKITALSWSWPAYYYYFTEAIINIAKEMGLSKDISKIIWYNTFFWAWALLEKSNLDIETLRKNITSPWWTTQKAIEIFESNNFKNSIEKAIKWAYKKAKELNNN